MPISSLSNNTNIKFAPTLNEVYSWKQMEDGKLITKLINGEFDGMIVDGETAV